MRADALHAHTNMPRFAQIRASCKKHPRQAEAVTIENIENRVTKQLIIEQIDK